MEMCKEEKFEAGGREGEEIQFYFNKNINKQLLRDQTWLKLLNNKLTNERKSKRNQETKSSKIIPRSRTWIIIYCISISRKNEEKWDEN